MIPNAISLYSVERSGQTLMNQKLGKRTALNEWFQAKPINELIGFAACAYASGRVASTNGFVEQKQGLFRTKAIGMCFIPGILKMEIGKGQNAYVGFIPSFLHRLRSQQTDGDYQDACFHVINLIKQYLYFREQKEQLARVVVVVEDNADLVEICGWIYKSGALTDDFDRIFYTGEGVLRMAGKEDLPGCFLKMKKSNTKAGYSIALASPDFVTV